MEILSRLTTTNSNVLHCLFLPTFHETPNRQWEAFLTRNCKWCLTPLWNALATSHLFLFSVNSSALSLDFMNSFHRIPKMVSDMIKNRAVFYVSLRMSICWESSVSLALTWLLQFYSDYIHAFATQIIKNEFFCFVNAKNTEIMPRCPPSVAMNDEVGSTASENGKFLHNIQTCDFDRIFHALDSNRDGMVSADDIQGLLEKLALQYFCDDKMRIMMNFPEHMSFDEFCRLCVNLLEEIQSTECMEGPSEKEELKEAFCVFDKDGDGFITPSELQHVLLSLGLREAQVLENCEAMIAKFDKNADGRIDFVEFENMLTLL